jgi:hypothetical protein
VSKPRTKNERLGKAPFDGFGQKGKPKTEGSGRKKGTPNKINKTARDIARAFVENRPIREIEKLFKDASKKDPAAALRGYFAAMEFVTPKLARQEVSGPDGGPQALEVRHVHRTYADPVPTRSLEPKEEK